jgi:hypothetical protein
MFWPALILLFKKANLVEQGQTFNRRSVKALAALLLFTFLMATPLSKPIWKSVHFLQQTQFPWRWLSITSIICPILLVMAFPSWTRLAKGKRRPLVVIALGTIAISFAFSVSHIVREARWLAPAELQQTLNTIPGTPGVTQWLPVWAHEPLPQMSSPVEAGDRQLTIQSWEPERRVFSVSAGQAIDARVRTFFYPHWKASVEGRPLAVHSDPNGALVVALPAESSTVTLEFREPLRVRYASGLTIFGWVSAIGGLCSNNDNSLPADESVTSPVKRSMSNLVKRFGPIALALLAGGIVLLPAMFLGMPKNNDLANHYHFAIPFYEALRHGDIYPGWLATPNYGYGDVVVRFYPPALYYCWRRAEQSPHWYAGVCW